MTLKHKILNKLYIHVDSKVSKTCNGCRIPQNMSINLENIFHPFYNFFVFFNLKMIFSGYTQHVTKQEFIISATSGMPAFRVPKQ